MTVRSTFACLASRRKVSVRGRQKKLLSRGRTQPTRPVICELLEDRTLLAGDFGFAVQLGGGSSDQGLSVAVDSSGNVYTTGPFAGTADFDPGAGTANLTSAGSTDTFVSKLDSAGNFVWARSMGGSSTVESRSIAVDSSGNVYTTGLFFGTADFDPGAGTSNLTSAGSTDIFVSKLDSAGSFVWARSMGGSSTDQDQALGIAVDSAGNVYTTGSFGGTADFDPGAGTSNLTSAAGRDIFVSKLDSAGDFVWAKSMDDSSSNEGKGIAVDSAGNVYTTGSFGGTADFDPGAGTANLTSAGSTETFVSKLDSAGDFVWARSLGGSSTDEGKGIAVDSSANVYTTGYFSGTADLDPGAGISNLTSAGSRDIFVSKLDSAGNFVWARGMGGSSLDQARDVAVDSLGNVYTTGRFGGTADFDPGAGTSNLTSAGSIDIFISKLDSAGDFVWARSMGGSSNDEGKDIAVDSSANVYTTGYFSGTADLDPGAGTANLTSVGSDDIFVSKLIENQPPSSNPGGPYFVSEDATIQLDASGTSDPDQATMTLSYQWDLDGDGMFGEVGTGASRGDEIGVSPTFSALGLAPGSIVAVSLLVTDDEGAADQASTIVTIAAADPVDLANIIENVITSGEAQVALSLSQSNVDEFLQAIANLPPNTGSDVDITFVLEQGTIGQDQVVSVPEGYTLIVDGANGLTVFEGGSPALTVLAGDVVFKNGILFTNTTAAPTILVSGGSLTLRNTIVEETTAGGFAAIEVLGGIVDLGTAEEAGGNVLNVNGSGELIRNSTPNDIMALGNTFQTDEADIADLFELEDEIYHGLDAEGLGLVTYVDYNVAPLVSITDISLDVVAVGEPVTFTGSFRDVGSLDTHAATWTFESQTIPDPILVIGNVDEALGSGIVTAATTFDTPGIYHVTLAVVDDRGGEGTANTIDDLQAMFVVYDPTGGFVTGGGWIDSAQGAYLPDPALAGKANFGFVSKYKKGASIPTGNTEFNFKAGDFNFHSNTYQWLVINQHDTNAQYKGSGMVNGDPAATGELYKFMIWAKDLDPGEDDTFRIKVWYEDGGEVVVYDNGFEQAIGGGNIKIHGSEHANALAPSSSMSLIPVLSLVGNPRQDVPSPLDIARNELLSTPREQAAADLVFADVSGRGLVEDTLFEELDRHVRSEDEDSALLDDEHDQHDAHELMAATRILSELL